MTTLPIPMIKRPLHPTGIWNWITTIDHKKIGILYGATAFINFLINIFREEFSIIIIYQKH